MYDFDRFESASGPVEPHPDRTSDRNDTERSPRPGVLVDVLTPHARIVVRTRNSCYHFEVVDAADRRVRITGGKLFPEATEMLLEGATTDAGSIKPGWISVGLPISLSSGLRRITTSRVESLAFERVPSAFRAA
jgi:hypothetical protein